MTILPQNKPPTFTGKNEADDYIYNLFTEYRMFFDENITFEEYKEAYLKGQEDG